MAHLLILALPLSVLIGAWAGGYWVCLTLFLVFVVDPLLDQKKKPVDETSVPPWFFTALLWGYAVAQTLAYWVAFGKLSSLGFMSGEWWGLTLSLGSMAGGGGIVAAHELVHRKDASERSLGLWLLCCVLYMHFRIEHVFGHHVTVATPEDPASARQGESIYTFWRRTLPGQLKSAYAFETERLKNKHPNNQMLLNRVHQYLAIEVVFFFAIWTVFGFGVCIAFLIQALFAVLHLETINYVEHYGLLRLKLPNATYERIQEKHSWDCPFYFTNAYVLNLGLHAHHHSKPGHHYEKLTLSKSGPHLPFGYATALILALFPRRWMQVMDPKIPIEMQN